MSHRSEVILFNYSNNESKAELNSSLLSTYEFWMKEKREGLLKVSVTFPFDISIASAISEDIFLAFWIFQYSYLNFFPWIIPHKRSGECSGATSDSLNIDSSYM